jgi:hypothetical protein
MKNIQAQVENMMEGPGGFLYPGRETAEEARLLEQARERAEAEQHLAKRLQKTCEQIGQIWMPGLEHEIGREAAIMQDPQIDKDWRGFKDYCAQWGFQTLPAPAEAIVAFLGQSKPKDVSRLHRSISAVHRAYFNDPTDDILVRAIVRQARAGSTKKPRTNGKGH